MTRRSLAALVGDLAGSDTPDEQTECLARAVYYESQGESLAGQLSVAEVIINRSRSGRFPSSVCGVVRQAGQFSFVRRGHIPQPPQAARNWRTAVAIARIAMGDLADSPRRRAHCSSMPGGSIPAGACAASRRSETTSSIVEATRPADLRLPSVPVSF